MKARQNLFTRFEAFMQRIVEAPFTFIFPSKLEPTEVARKLERALEDNRLLQSEGRRLAPNVYDIYLSIKDHQQLSQGQEDLKRDWQSHLIAYARQQRYILRITPIIRLHPESALRPGVVRIVAELVDRQHMGGNSTAEGGIMETQALSPAQLAQWQAQLPPGQQLAGIPGSGSPLPNPPGQGSVFGQAEKNSGNHSPGGIPPSADQVYNTNLAPVTQLPANTTPPLPQAWLTIRLPQAGQQVYRIEKPVVNIGRQLTNDIIVEDKRVSRNHAQIKYQQDGQFGLFDLGSTNGITINNTPNIRKHTLRSGDRFTIGSYDFYFERR